MNRIWRIAAVLVVLALVAGGAGTVWPTCARALDAEGKPLEMSIELADGSGNEVATLSTMRLYSEKPRSVAVECAFTNHGEVTLTWLEYRVKYLDADGNVFMEPPRSLETFMDDPVQPGETRVFVQKHYFDGAETVAGVVLEPMGVKDAAEVKPWTEPRPGSLLPEFANDPDFAAHFENLDDNLPVEMFYHVDQEVDETVTDPAEIRAAIERLAGLRIGGAVNIGYDDAGIYYGFTMADGGGWSVSFETPGLLSWHGRNYEVIE
ncbi:MAG: hypothetical protein IJI71_02720 [Clostridia bacterium]|nr:hypothetical protein [Clostridia bacterium]